jgi:outer membrane protein assembly factor BamB/tetratricopeptide (TPR) repeat protein
MPGVFRVNAHKISPSRPYLRLICFALTAPCLIVFSVAAAQVPQRTFSPVYSFEAERLLRTADQLAREGQWAEVIDLYLRVIQQHAGRVTALPKDDPQADPSGLTRLYVDARLHCQRRIAALPPDAIALYRNRTDPQAEAWFRRGGETQDPSWFRRIIEEAFCSSWGDDAALALADLAFREGRFSEALALFNRLLPADIAPPGTLVHPDPQVDRSQLAAKIILAKVALGRLTDQDLAAFRDAFPDAQGALAGRKGRLADLLADAIREDDLEPSAELDERWPTFAGSNARGDSAPTPVEAGSFLWRVKLEPAAVVRQYPPANARLGGMGRFAGEAASSPEPALPYFPIIVGDQIVLCDDASVTAYHLAPRANPESGQAAITPAQLLAWDQKLRTPFGDTPARTPISGTVRYSLSAAADRIFVRLGSLGSRGLGGTLIAIRNNRQVEGKRLWERAASDISLPREPGDNQNRFAAFEGAPIATDVSVFIALTETGTETGCYVACLDAESGATRWVRYLGNSNAPVDGFAFQAGASSTDVGHRLLASDGDTLFYLTHMGALAALDVQNGSIRWLATYPTRDRARSVNLKRAANPAIVQAGKVVIAPDDSAPVFAFEAATGRLLWKSQPLEQAVHLLGFAKGGIALTGDHVWLLDPDSGKVRATWPEVGAFDGYGRGLLAGDAIFWPTKTDIKVLDQTTGTPGGHPPIRLLQQFGTSGGNLAIGDGYLAIAQRDALVVFAGNARLIEQYQQEIAQNPQRALLHFRLGRVAEALGQYDLATQSFAAALSHAKPHEDVDGLPLPDEARARLFHLYMHQANTKAQARDWTAAAQAFEQAESAALTDRDRLAARIRLAEIHESNGSPARAVADLQNLLAQDNLRLQLVEIDPQRSLRAEVWIKQQLERLIQNHGRLLYADYDAKARALFDRGRDLADPRPLLAIAQVYPLADVLPRALLELARVYEKEKRWADAALAYKRLAALESAEPRLAALALLELARVYESQRLWAAASQTYQTARDRFGTIQIQDPAADLVGSVDALVASRAARLPAAASLMSGGEPAFAWPLQRQGESHWTSSARPLAPDGFLPAPDTPSLFLYESRKLRPVLDSEKSWHAPLEDDPHWLGFLAGRLLVGTPRRLLALDLESGAVAWKFPSLDPHQQPDLPGPFVSDNLPRDDRDPSRPTGRFHAFHLQGDRLICLQGDSALLALDGATGRPDWIHFPESGSINRHLLVSPERVVAQLQQPAALLVLDAATGRSIARFSQPDETDPWAHAPLPLDDDRLAVALQSQTVGVFSLAQGKMLWSYRDQPTLPRRGTPRILGDRSRLLVLYDGNDLVCLDPAQGQRLWNRRLGLEDISDADRAFALDARRFYSAIGGKLTALNLADGEPAWSKTLVGPSGGWNLLLEDQHILAYTDPARAPEGKLDHLVLLSARRDSGQIVQRLVIPGAFPTLALRLLPSGIELATAQAAWKLAPMDASAPNR